MASSSDRFRAQLLPDSGDSVGGDDQFPKPLQMRPPKPRYKTLLAIDGGGLRGVLPAIVLEQVEQSIRDYIVQTTGTKAENVEIDLADYFDCIVGTSVGSILTAYFATKGQGAADFITSKAIVKTYGRLRPGSAKAAKIPFIERGRKIFHRPRVLSRLVPQAVKQAVRPKYRAKGLTATLTEMFGDLKLSDCKTSVVIPTFELETSRPYAFWVNADKQSGIRDRGTEAVKTGYSFVKVRAEIVSVQSTPQSQRRGVLEMYQKKDESGREVYDPDMVYEPNHDFKLMEVVRASASAPTFFPAATVHHESEVGGPKDKLYVDGGMIANNPTIEGITFISGEMRVPVQRIAVLSIGTGSAVPNLVCKAKKGILGWGGELFGVLMDRQSEYLQSVVDKVYYDMLDSKMGQYTRIQLARPANHPDAKVLSSMDNPNNLPKLRNIGDEVSRASKKGIDDFVRNFIFATDEG